MEIQDPEIIEEFVVESTEHLADIENQLLTIESTGADIDVDLVNTVFRAVHSIKGAAGFLGLATINELAHSLENVLNLMRERELVPTSRIIDVMLRAADQLRGLIEDVPGSNDVDVTDSVAALQAIASGSELPAIADSTDTLAEEAGNQSVSNIESSSESDIAAALAKADALIAAAAEQGVLPCEMVSDNRSSNTTKSLAETQNQANGNSVSQEPKRDGVASRGGESNIRVSVESLDRLMNLAGELVLGRNQLLQTITTSDTDGLEAVAAKINQVTCEMQDAIMQTRMQPIGNVFTRFNRVVRDLSAKLGKQCQLSIDGKEVEVDKTIVEAIADPLTHLVRNSVDHGIESPEKRIAAGKSAQGILELRAFHQSGKVCIEINDDGGGINANVVKQKAVEKGIITADQADEMHDADAYRLILMPGFSTAEAVSDVSGRGVGMDVVRTNIEKLGGTVEISSKLGRGTRIQVTLPLTLAIIPSLIVNCGGDRFAVPQVNIVELVRVRGSELKTRIGTVRNAEVLRLRGTLLPLVRLDSALDMGTSVHAIDERDANCEATSAVNIIVVETGQLRYGLVVDGLHDSEEIVVKPLGQHFKDCQCLSGATILGDGRVALILDVAGISQHLSLGIGNDRSARATELCEEDRIKEDRQSLLLFNNHETEQFAVPMDVIARIERVQATSIRNVGDQLLLQYHDASLPLICVEDHLSAKPRSDSQQFFVVVFELCEKEIGLVTPILHDVREVTANVDDSTLREPGVMGSLVLDGVTTRLIDLPELVGLAHPEWNAWSIADAEQTEQNKSCRILLAEDSKFFRNQVKKHLETNGYTIVEAEDGQDAWDQLCSNASEFDLVVTDIQMPRMDGFELCEHIKGDQRTKHLPVIALTSLAGADDMQRGQDCGVDDYQIKMDREKLLRAVANLRPTNLVATATH